MRILCIDKICHGYFVGKIKFTKVVEGAVKKEIRLGGVKINTSLVTLISTQKKSLYA